MRPLLVSLLLLAFLCTAALATKEKDTSQDQGDSGIVMFWPSQDNAILKLTFSRFQNLATYAGKMSLVSNVIVQNVSAKSIPKASFSVALLDKDRVRVGSGTLVIDDLNPGESAKEQFQCESVGAPAVLSISARNNGGVPTSTKTIPMTVISVPAGATLKVDDKDEGLTPARINVGVGTHQLELRKEGFAVVTTPLEVAPDEAHGGSITITLGGLTDDTIELRDGSIITGSVMSMTLESVLIDVNGQQQTLDRNKVKKMFLVERIVAHPETDPQSPGKKQAATPSSTPHH
ncbi:MAG: PEGA domain-containing protein [Acidobacteriia bacterium]|nr:PEGA domain-containing protein [Terriglobia bacterium]